MNLGKSTSFSLRDLCGLISFLLFLQVRGLVHHLLCVVHEWDDVVHRLQLPHVGRRHLSI